MREPIEPEDDGIGYSVRPEPPRFDELVRQHGPLVLRSPTAPFGPIRRRLASQQAGALVRLGLVGGIVALLAIAVL